MYKHKGGSSSVQGTSASLPSDSPAPDTSDGANRLTSASVATQKGQQSQSTKSDDQSPTEPLAASEETEQDVESQNRAVLDVVQRRKKPGVFRDAYSLVTEWQAESIREASIVSGHGELDVTGYRHEIDTDHVRHAFRQHGDSKKEAKRNQVAITEEDFLLIPEILAAPDKVEDIGKNRKGLRVIRYKKAFNGDVLFVEEVRTGRKTLALNTLYKKAARPGASSTSEKPQIGPTSTGDLPVPSQGPAATKKSTKSADQSSDRNAELKAAQSSVSTSAPGLPEAGSRARTAVQMASEHGAPDHPTKRGRVVVAGYQGPKPK